MPLYLSQALAVVMYVFGFREGWLWIYPRHPPLLVDLSIFALVFAIGYLSASLAFKIQYAVMVVIALSLGSGTRKHGGLAESGGPGAVGPLPGIC